jgi:ComF family protein
MKFLDFIFPRQCILCWTTGAYLCKICKKKLDPHPEICPICHRFSKDYQTCINCKSNKEFFLEWIIIPFRYDNTLKKLIIKLKYFHKKDISGFLIERLALALEANETFQRESKNSAFWILNSELLISFVPTHRYRHYFVKGYNQSKILTKNLSEITWIPRIEIAKKSKHTKTQASLDRNGRLKNLKNTFSLIPNNKLIGNETILIVDDITTTWSTINELAKLIKFHYPNIKVRGAVLWRHIG